VIQHVCEHLRPHLPSGVWLLAHELTAIIVQGDAPDARSLGGATLAMPDADDGDLLREYTERLLESLQDQLVSLQGRGWPGASGMLNARAEVRDGNLLLGYLTAGGSFAATGVADVVLPPFPLPAPPRRAVLAG
jgi:hypothetical protein